MLRKDKVPDSKITQQVNQKLSGGGLRPPSRVTVTSSNGDVTLTGNIQYEHQRQAAMQATRGIDGIRRVIDRLLVLPAVRRAH
jgi:osmotically-inducible protein OsmY